MAERALVVVPTYNERTNIPLLIPAILIQDPRLEVLVVDDNSPDGTGQLADDLAKNDARVHVLMTAGDYRPEFEVRARQIGILSYITPLASTTLLVLVSGRPFSGSIVVATVMILGAAVLGMRAR